MSGVLDTIGDLVHHPIDTITGMLKAPTPPPKPPYTSTDSTHVAGGYGNKNRQSQIDAQVAQDGG